MAKKYTNTESTNSTWTEVARDVMVRKSANSEYFSLNWYGAVIHGCAIRHGQNGDFISWPSFKNSKGEFVKRAYVWAEKGSDDEITLNRVIEAVKKL